jgi:hypothetical protein
MQNEKTDRVLTSLVEALTAVRPVLVQALNVCDQEGVGPSEEACNNALSLLDAALKLANTDDEPPPPPEQTAWLHGEPR